MRLNPETVHSILGTALQAAAANGHTNVARELFTHGADPNTHGTEWNSQAPAIALAVKSGNKSLVQYLLEARAKPHSGYPTCYSSRECLHPETAAAQGEAETEFLDWEGSGLNIGIAHE